MRRFTLALCAVCFLCNLVRGEETTMEAAQPLIAQLTNTQIAVSDKMLEEVAVLAFRTASAVPEKGLEASRKELEGLTALRKQLEKHSGAVENLLAIRLQRVVDSTVLYEILRQQAAEANVSLVSPYRNPDVQPPFVAGSVKPEIVRALLDENKVDEQARVEFVLKGDSRLAEGFRKGDVTVQEILGGTWREKVPAEVYEPFARIRGGPVVLGVPDEEGPAAVKDFLLVSTFVAVDQARDTRRFASLYLENRLPTTPALLRAAIKEQLKANPVRRVTESMPAHETHGRELIQIGNFCKDQNGLSRTRILIALLSPFVPHLALFGPVADDFFAPRMAGYILRQRPATSNPATTPPGRGRDLPGG